MGIHIATVAAGLIERRRPIRAGQVLAQRFADTVCDQRQIVYAMRIESDLRAGGTGWGVERASREKVAAYFPNAGYDIASTNGECLLLTLDGAVAGFAVFKRPDSVPSFYFDLPRDGVYLAYTFLSPLARGGMYADASAVIYAYLWAKGFAWMVMSTNDWNEPVIRSCQRAGMIRLGVGRRTGRRFVAERELLWLA